MAKIAVMGTSYVGLATGAHLSSLGNTVLCPGIYSAHLTGLIYLADGCLCPH